MSTEVDKAFDKTQHPFMEKEKTLRKIGAEGSYLNLINSIYNKPKVNIHLTVKDNVFPPKLGGEEVRISTVNILNIMLEVLSSAIR